MHIQILIGLFALMLALKNKTLLYLLQKSLQEKVLTSCVFIVFFSSLLSFFEVADVLHECSGLVSNREQLFFSLITLLKPVWNPFASSPYLRLNPAFYSTYKYTRFTKTLKRCPHLICFWVEVNGVQICPIITHLNPQQEAGCTWWKMSPVTLNDNFTKMKAAEAKVLLSYSALIFNVAALEMHI